MIFVCHSCDSWAVRVVEEIFNNMSSILMFHRIFAAHVSFPVLWSWYFCWIISCVNFLILFFLGIPMFGWKCSKKKTFTSVGGLPRFQRWVLPTKVGRFVSFRRLCCEVKGGEDKSSSNFKVRFPVVEPVANVYPVMLPMSFKDLEATPFSYQGLLCFNLNPKGFNRSVSWNKVGVGNRSLILNYRSCYIPFIAANYTNST